MRAEDHFHVGVVVDDLDRALDELATLFGYEWSDEVHVEQPVTVPGGEVSVDFQFRYSRNAPRLEIIQSQPGTLWMPVEGSGLHHLGYWSADLAADGDALVQAGYAFEASGAGLDGATGWSYYRHPLGPRVELVSRSLQAFLEQLWA